MSCCARWRRACRSRTCRESQDRLRLLRVRRCRAAVVRQLPVVRRLALPVKGLRLLSETQLERILATLEAARPRIAVIDSIQTVWTETLQSAPGSVAQVRECAAQLTRYAKRAGAALFIVGHVTKEGAIAGPRVLEHIVDTV